MMSLWYLGKACQPAGGRSALSDLFQLRGVIQLTPTDTLEMSLPSLLEAPLSVPSKDLQNASSTSIIHVPFPWSKNFIFQQRKYNNQCVAMPFTSLQ